MEAISDSRGALGWGLASSAERCRDMASASNPSKNPVVPSVSIQKGMVRELHFLKRGSKNKRAVVGGLPLTTSIPRLLKDFADQKCTFPSPAPFPDQCKLSKGVQRHVTIRNKDPEKGLGGIWAI